MSACSSKRVTELILKASTNIRNEEPFTSLMILLFKKLRNNNKKGSIKTKKKKVQNYSILQDFDGIVSSGHAYHPYTPRAYLRGIYYEAIDSITSALETRLNQPSYHAYEVIENLLLNKVNKEDTSAEQDFNENDVY